MMNRPLVDDDMTPQAIDDMSSGTINNMSPQAIDDIPSEGEKFSLITARVLQEVQLGYEIDRCSGSLSVRNKNN
jgi:hypothetical protein